MPNVTNTAIINITTSEDTTSNVIINRSVPNLAFDSSVAEGVIYRSLANGANIISLPAATYFQLYVRNNDPALLITVSTNSGAIAQLSPGEVCLVWLKTTGVGFSSLTLNASGAGALVEFFIGA